MIAASDVGRRVRRCAASAGVSSRVDETCRSDKDSVTLAARASQAGILSASCPFSLQAPPTQESLSAAGAPGTSGCHATSRSCAPGHPEAVAD